MQTLLKLFFGFTLTLAHPQSKETWKAWLAERNRYLQSDSNSPFALEDTTSLKAGSTIYLRENASRLEWTESLPAKYLVSAAAQSKKVILTNPRLEVVELAIGDSWSLNKDYNLSTAEDSDGSIRVFAYHVQNDRMKAFSGISYFPFTGTAVTKASFTRFTDAKKVSLPTSGSRSATAFLVGQVRFKLFDHTAALDAYTFGSPQSLDLFIPFMDATNGKTTYGGGRYLEPSLVSEKSTSVVLDFNQAHNPFCAYNSLYSCILINGNRLDFAVSAGEKHTPSYRPR